MGGRCRGNWPMPADGSRHCIDNTDELRAWVLDLAGQIRAERRRLLSRSRSIPSPANAVLAG